MMPMRSPRLPALPAARRINRAPSRPLAIAVPWVTIMLGSMVPALPLIASAPLLPPMGMMLMIAWRQVRPGLLPIWAGLPLGAVDDLYSGQPFGSAILLWSFVMIVLDVIETRFPWRNFWLDWLTAALLLVAAILAGSVFANAAGGRADLVALSLPLTLSVLFYPLAGRLVAVFDRFRLLPFARVR